MTEQPLPGGVTNGPVRVGETVRRGRGPHSEFVAELLDHFERLRWAGAPRALGVDEQRRDVLSFVDGYVPWRSPTTVETTSMECLSSAARLVRQFHDLTAGSLLAGSQEVVCHNDLAPKNTVYRGSAGHLRAVAFIDWDLAAPGARIHDVAHLCWQFLDLGPTVADLDETVQRLRVICDAYGLAERSRLIETVLWWQDRCWQGIENAARAGDPAMMRLREMGAVRSVREAHDWVLQHRSTLEKALAAR